MSRTPQDEPVEAWPSGAPVPPEEAQPAAPGGFGQGHEGDDGPAEQAADA